MMKGCQYDRRFLTRGVQPHVYAIEESNAVKREQLSCLGAGLSDLEKNAAKMQLQGLLADLKDAKEYGSILTVKSCDWDLLRRYADNIDAEGQLSMEYIGIDDTVKQLKKLINVGEVLSQKYDAVVTNPPYMGASGMGADLSKYVKERYPDSKSDLFAVFIERCEKFTETHGYQAMITQHAWMFLSSFEKLRMRLLASNDISTMVHLGARAFEEIGGEVVQTTSFVMHKGIVKNYKGKYCRLIDPITQYGKEKMFLEKEKRYTSEQDNFSKIPGSPAAYWVSDNFVRMFSSKRLKDISRARRGLETGNNEKYLKYWYEVNETDIDFNCRKIDEFKKKWLPHNKGGNYRNWYGNFEYIVWFYNNGNDIRQSGNLNGYDAYLKSGITWTALTSNKNSFRWTPIGHTFDSNKGPLIVDNKDGAIYYILAFLNSKIAQMIIKILNPTLSLQNGDMDKLPINIDYEKKDIIDEYTKECIQKSKRDWDSSETSWDFDKSPLI